MKKFFKWLVITILALAVIGFFAFLYFIPPFMLVPPEGFSKEVADASKLPSAVSDQAKAQIAERGRYIVVTTGCADCHTAQGDQGPEWDRFLAGGFKFAQKDQGIFVSRNLTPDKETGLARRTDEQVLRILRTGLNTEGRILRHRMMPWAMFSHWTMEDRYAVLTYLRNLKPVHNAIPDQNFSGQPTDPASEEEFYAGDFGKH